MPTYEYACGACAHEWEQSQRITEAPIEVCPKCAKSTAHRLISGGTNFILKGRGWYSDLYATPKSSSKSPEDKASGEKTESKPDNGGETKTGKTDGGGGSGGETTDTTNKPAAKAASAETSKPAPSSSSAPSS